MNLLNYLKDNNINSFDQVQQHLSSKPFNLSIKSNGDLYRLIYNEKKSDLNNPIVKECCGLILDVNQVNKIVCYSLNKTEDVEIESNLDYSNFTVDSFDLSKWEDLKVEELIDGTLIRLYNHNDTWYTSTKKVIDATIGYWHSNKSFHQLFLECSSNLDYSRLDKENFIFL